MDRPKVFLAGCGLAVLLMAPGCRSARPEVPPGPRYSGDGKQAPSVGFSSEPHPAINNGMPYAPGVAPGSATGAFGTPVPNGGERYGAPTNNAYGPPGSSRLGGGGTPGSALPPSSDPSANPPMTTAPGGPTLPPVGAAGTPNP